MKVTIRSDGHTVEIDTDEKGMTTQKLANLAERIWERTVQPGAGAPAAGLSSERRQGVRLGRFGARFGFADQPLEAS